MKGKNLKQTGFIGPVKLADIGRADMYLDYLAKWSPVAGNNSGEKKGDRLLFTFPNLSTAVNKNP